MSSGGEKRSPCRGEEAGSLHEAPQAHREEARIAEGEGLTEPGRGWPEGKSGAHEPLEVPVSCADGRGSRSPMIDDMLLAQGWVLFGRG
jgi:hypothetical protein